MAVSSRCKSKMRQGKSGVLPGFEYGQRYRLSVPSYPKGAGINAGHAFGALPCCHPMFVHCSMQQLARMADQLRHLALNTPIRLRRHAPIASDHTFEAIGSEGVTDAHESGLPSVHNQAPSSAIETAFQGWLDALHDSGEPWRRRCSATPLWKLNGPGHPAYPPTSQRTSLPRTGGHGSERCDCLISDQKAVAEVLIAENLSRADACIGRRNLARRSQAHHSLLIATCWLIRGAIPLAVDSWLSSLPSPNSKAQSLPERDTQ